MRSRILARTLVCTTLLLGAAAPTVAHAEPSATDRAQARELGEQAIAAFDAKNYAEAERLFASAHRLFPAPTLLLGLARSQANLGKLVLAQESYNRILREHSEATNLSPAFKDAVDAAKAEVGPVSARVASVVLHVDGATSPAVTLDGQPVSAAALGLKRPVDPGTHVVRAEAAGYTPAETTFHVAEAGTAEATLKLEKATDATPVAVAPPVAPATNDRASGAGRDRTLAYAALGVGAAGLVFGGITGVLALGKHGDLEGQCPGGTCPSDRSDDVDGYRTMGTLSTVGFAVGAVGVAAGAVLWFTAPVKPSSTTARSDGTRAAALTWKPYVSAGGGGVTGTF